MLRMILIFYPIHLILIEILPYGMMSVHLLRHILPYFEFMERRNLYKYTWFLYMIYLYLLLFLLQLLIFGTFLL